MAHGGDLREGAPRRCVLPRTVHLRRSTSVVTNRAWTKSGTQKKSSGHSIVSIRHFFYSSIVTTRLLGGPRFHPRSTNPESSNKFHERFRSTLLITSICISLRCAQLYPFTPEALTGGRPKSTPLGSSELSATSPAHPEHLATK